MSYISGQVSTFENRLHQVCSTNLNLTSFIQEGNMYLGSGITQSSGKWEGAARLKKWTITQDVGNLIIPLFGESINFSNGLAGWWQFNEGAGTSVGDSGPNGLVGTASDAVLWSANGGVTGGACLNLSADSLQSVTFGSPAQLDLHGAMTISVWVNTSNSNPLGTVVFGDNVGDGTPIYNITMNQDGLGMFRYEHWTAPLTSYTVISKAVTDATWNHICVTRTSAGLAKFYVNGVLSIYSTNGTVGPPLAGALVNATVGVAGSAAVQYFNGFIDNLRIYNRVLNITEITNLYQRFL